MLAPGQMVDHYRIRQLVGRGGMGAVYLARDTRSAGAFDGRPYLALEYLEGRTLRVELSEARLPVGRALRIALSVADAHGSVVSLDAVAGGVWAETDVGDREWIDLSIFADAPCVVLEAVELAVPTIWRGDPIAVSAGPSGRCPPRP